MCTVPSVGCHRRTDSRRTNLSRGGATLLSSHAGDPRAAAGDTTGVGQSKDDTQYLSQPAAVPRPTGRVGCNRPVTVEGDTEVQYRGCDRSWLGRSET